MTFQSLLSWISRFGWIGKRGDVDFITSFNPCCLGLAVLAKCRHVLWFW